MTAVPTIVGQSEAAQAREKIAVATFSILQDLLETVGRGLWTVHGLVRRNADTHSYQPTPWDARRLAEAELLVSNGFGFEAWLGRLIAAAPFKGRHVLATEGIVPMLRAETPGSTARTEDPHCWQDVTLVRRYVGNIAEGLAGADASHAGRYRAQADELDRRLAALDAWIRDEIGRVPPNKQRVITSHDAFGYFARAYGVEFLAARGINPDHDPTPGEVAHLIALVRSHKVNALFIENLGNRSMIDQIARDAGGFVGQPLYADSLSAPDGPAATYEALMRHNVTALVSGMLRN